MTRAARISSFFISFSLKHEQAKNPVSEYVDIRIDGFYRTLKGKSESALFFLYAVFFPPFFPLFFPKIPSIINASAPSEVTLQAVPKLS